MEKPPQYVISSKSVAVDGKKGYLIYNENHQIMVNHCGWGYPPMSKKLANVLVKDINEILLLDVYLDEGDPKKGFNYSEVNKHVKFRDIRNKQEQMSFAVCVHNTLIAMEDDPNFRLELDPVIQWDFLYRMSPGPSEKMEQMNATAPAIHWLGKDWVDLPGNYVSTTEEMEVDEIPFVPQVIIDRLYAEIATMTLPEQVAVWYLFEFFQRFSITIPILWVKGMVSSACLENSYYVLASDFSLKEIRSIRKQEGDFVQKRLSYLRKYLKANRPKMKTIMKAEDSLATS